MMIETICYIIVGIITIGLSINSGIKERELRKANDSLASSQGILVDLYKKQIEHAAELNEKQNEIIRLQKVLQGKSDFQSTNIDRLKNPIPESLEITFTSTIELSKSEIEQIGDILRPVSKTHGNLLPFNTDRTNAGFEKINSFKNIFLRLEIAFHNGDKILTIMFNKGPLNLQGYNTPNTKNAFILAYQDDKSIVMFHGFALETSDITTNYKSPSFLDFENSKVSISYEFSFPVLRQIGSIPSISYMSTNQNYLNLNIESVALRSKKLTMNISNLKRVGSHNYEGIWKDESK